MILFYIWLVIFLIFGPAALIVNAVLGFFAFFNNGKGFRFGVKARIFQGVLGFAGINTFFYLLIRSFH